jgi:hypothetical protein
MKPVREPGKSWIHDLLILAGTKGVPTGAITVFMSGRNCGKSQIRGMTADTVIMDDAITREKSNG